MKSKLLNLILAFFFILLCSISVSAQYSKIQGWAQKGGLQLNIGGITPAQKLQQSYPLSTVTIYNAGTTNLATIFSDSLGTPKSNPFSADANSYWFFYAGNGTYDVSFSGTGISSPFTLGDFKIGDATAGISGSGTANKVTKWTSTGAVGNSTITDNGTSVGFNNSSPAASAIIDLTSTTQGFLGPRMTQTQRDAIVSPAQGLIVFNTSTGVYNYYNSGWTSISGSGISSLNGLNTATQTFSVSNDTNITLNINSSGSTHTFTPGFSGTLAKARQNSNTVYIDQSNTYTAGAKQIFQNSATIAGLNLSSSSDPSVLSQGDIWLNNETLKFRGSATSWSIATQTAVETLTNKTLTTPTIASFVNATHSHQNAAGGGTLAADLIFASGKVPIANGGSNADSSSYSTNGAFYFDGTKFVTTATGGAGTLCLVSTAGGTPTFGSCSGSAATALSSITAATTSNTINSADNAQIWNWTLTTSSKKGFRFSENSASAAAGTPILIAIDTLSTSTVNPFQVTAGGTANGIRVDTTGKLSIIGTGSILASDITGITAAGDLTGTYPSPTLAILLSASSCTNCNLTYDSKGRITVAASGSSSGVSTVGTIDSQSKSANGLVISGSSIFAQTADASFPGQWSTGTQTLAGAKTFTGAESFTSTISQLTGGSVDPLNGPNLVGTQTVAFGSAWSSADSASGDRRQLQAYIINSGTRNIVAGTFGARADGNGLAEGINPYAYANSSGASVIADETDFGVLTSGGVATGKVLVIVGNFSSTGAFLQIQSGASGISAANGIVFNKGGAGLDPISGSAITFAGSPSMAIGTDYSGATFSTAPYLLANNSFPKAKNASATNIIIGGVDASNWQLFQSGGSGVRWLNAANTLNIFRIIDDGGIVYNVITPSQITSNQNNYNPTSSAYMQRWSTDASRNVTGLTFTTAQLAGQVVLITNVGSFNIVIQNENASSTAANRFTTTTGADITLAANKMAMAIYDGTTTRWRVSLLP